MSSSNLLSCPLDLHAASNNPLEGGKGDRQAKRRQGEHLLFTLHKPSKLFPPCHQCTGQEGLHKCFGLERDTVFLDFAEQDNCVSSRSQGGREPLGAQGRAVLSGEDESGPCAGGERTGQGTQSWPFVQRGQPRTVGRERRPG